MSIKENTRKILLASSGGFCQNPNCNTDLFKLLSNNKITNIYEGAHIIAKKEDGPRGKNSIPLSDRDEFDNIILLCPTCHKIIDKNPESYPTDLLKKWKSNHNEKIKAIFSIPLFQDRKDMIEIIRPLLMENQIIFNEYGPFSEHAKQKPISDAYLMWNNLSIEKIIPNNRRIEQILEINKTLLSKEELITYNRFKLHKEGFEYNKLSGNKNPDVPRFPIELNNLLII